MINKRNKKLIEKIGFDFEWDKQKVWLIRGTIKEKDLNSLKWHLYAPFWPHKKYNYSPIDVISKRHIYGRRYSYVMDVDLSYPITIMKNKFNKLVIIDGIHRLLKSYILNYKKVKVKQISRRDIPNIQKF